MQLPEASKEFLSHCQFEKNLSEKTLKAYKTDLAQLLTFMKSQSFDVAITAISKTELKEYLISIGSLKPKSIKRKIATVKALFNYLEFEDILAINPFRKMRINIKEPKRLPLVMDIREITRIFKTAYSYKNTETTPETYSYFRVLRDIVILELLFSTGARVSEIAGLTKENINLDSGNVTIRGKGDKERAIQICNRETIDLLKHYYKMYRQPIEKAGNFFLINRLGHKLSDQSIRAIVKKIAGTAGINRHITPHMFRHSFATLLLERDVDIKYIQSLLGHSSIMTTQIYTHVNRAKQKQILRTKHPRKDFNMQLSSDQ
ncbi:MAG: tyrosine-type recombinase/integrase [Bacteroidota bacterium]